MSKQLKAFSENIPEIELSPFDMAKMHNLFNGCDIVKINILRDRKGEIKQNFEGYILEEYTEAPFGIPITYHEEIFVRSIKGEV